MQLFALLIGALFAAQACAQAAARGRIESCSGWKLNKLPDVKKFLKDPEHATSYEDVEVNFVRGRPPVLTIYDKVSGEAEEKINLEKFNLEEMHELLVSRGFVRRPRPVNSSDESSTNEDGGVLDQTAKKERHQGDAATAERKLKSTEARRLKAEARAEKRRSDKGEGRAEKRRLDKDEARAKNRRSDKGEARAEKRRFDKAKIKARVNEEL